MRGKNELEIMHEEDNLVSSTGGPVFLQPKKGYKACLGLHWVILVDHGVVSNYKDDQKDRYIEFSSLRNNMVP